MNNNVGQISLTNYTNKESLISATRGENGFDFVTRKNLSVANQGIQSRYKKIAFYKGLTGEAKNEVDLRCLNYNVEKIIDYIATGFTIGTLVGGGVGALYGAAACHAPGAVAGAKAGVQIGAPIGTAAGIAYALYDIPNIYSDKKTIKAYVSMHEDFQAFKAQKSVEEYKLFTTFVKNYFSDISAEQGETIDNYICIFSYEIPEVPVFSPHDVKRLHPYEKSLIERRLDEVEADIQRCRDSGLKEEYINGLKDNICPHRMGYFTKDQLVYDLNFTKKVAQILSKIATEIVSREGDNRDPILEEGIQALLSHYRKFNSEMVDKLSDDFMKDAIHMGTSVQKAYQMGELIKKVNQF